MVIVLSELCAEIENYFDAAVGKNSLLLLIRNLGITLERPETFDESTERWLRMKFRVAQELDYGRCRLKSSFNIRALLTEWEPAAYKNHSYRR